MSKKDKNAKPVEVFSEEEFDEADMDESELKEKKKEAKKKEKREQADYENDVLNDNPKTKAGRTFKMYKFIIKLIIMAILIAFAIVMIVKQDEMIGVVYMVFGIVILVSAIIRMIPLLKTSTHNRARLVLLVQVVIHLVLGAYLLLSAFYHWNILDKIREENIPQAKTLEQQLNEVTGGKFALFNISAFTYILVAYLFTFAIAYYWVTILYKENTKRSMFWLNTAACTLALALAIFAQKLTAATLVWVVISLAVLGAVVIGGEAAGGYYRYRKLIAHPTKEKKAEKTDAKDAPAEDTEKDYTEIDPTTIPVEEPREDSNVIS